MKALLIVAHGSRRESSNEEVRQVAAAVREHAGDRYGCVEAAFLELAEPSIPGGIQRAIDRGAAEVVVLPYFLSAGRHVAEDIPREVAGKQQEHPAVTIRIAPYLGAAGGIAETLLGLASEKD